MSDREGGAADPQDVPMAEKYGTHGATEPSGSDSAKKAYDASNAPEPGPGREVSAEEEAGVSSTDMDATSALGVGESVSRRGEDVVKEEGEEAGKETIGYKDERPVGTSDARSATSVDPHGSDEGTTDMPPGDQGG